MSAEDVQQIRAHGWRQCMVLPTEAHSAIGGEVGSDLPPDSICIVVSHSCDILQRNYDAEPYVEIITGSPIGKVDGNFTAGKNPRRLHLLVADGGRGATEAYEFRVGSRHMVRRSLLATFAPDSSRELSPFASAELINWIVLRYRRQAFPNAFQQRVSNGFKELKAKAKAMTDIAALHIGLQPWGEVEDEQEYEVVLLAVVGDAVANNADRLKAAQKSFYEFEAALAGIPGLFVNRDVNRVASEDDVLVSELKLLPKWTDFDSISIADQDHHLIESSPLLILVR